jgi:diguanylate cyclase (GGDEF)-like protein/PAS domain S-box-containing protein
VWLALTEHVRHELEFLQVSDAASGGYMRVLTHRSGGWKEPADGIDAEPGGILGRTFSVDAVVAAAQTATADISVITDADQAILSVSDFFVTMTGYRPAELLGRNCRMLQGPGTDDSTRQQIRDVLASGQVFEGQILNYRKDGAAFWTALKIIPMRVGNTSDVTHYVSVQRDITNKIAMLKQLQTQALHDYVTGLPNRTAAEQAVEKAVQRTPGAGLTALVCLIDLDDFRDVNNTFGHAAGDAVLQQWATRVLARLREGDVLARMGGDEFLLILENITPTNMNEHLPLVLNRIHEAVDEPFPVDGQQVRIGMSMGIAVVPEDGTDSRSILRSADDALYTAKGRTGGTQWWETAAHAHAHPLIEEDVSSAHSAAAEKLEKEESYRSSVRQGRILVHFQPVLNLRTGSVHLFEALARLRHADGSIVHPEEFLPHLGVEEERLLFADVLDQALAVLESWDRRGDSYHVSVNLPPAILSDGTTPGVIAWMLGVYGIEPGRLGLELLESQAMNLEEQRIALQELVGLGVGLAMDDLGSGYSSLQRLSSFPFSAIKLDRGLFLHVQENPLRTLSLMATLIQMGRDLSMDVVVEGLEDESLTEAAVILGAPLGQGYYLARPMTPDACMAWLDEFTYDLHRSPIRTFLGALAYHWQFSRLSAPHPLDVKHCPVTRFLDDSHAGTDVAAWHHLQHVPGSANPASSRLLIAWLTRHTQASRG